MKSIYLRNFTAMAVLVIFCLMLICLSFVGIGRMHLVRVLREEMIASAEEVARIAAAVGQGDSPDSWLLGMNASSSGSLFHACVSYEIAGHIPSPISSISLAS